MAWPWSTTPTEIPDMTGLTAEDRADFARLNEAVTRVAKVAKIMVEGGRALKAVRDRQLYRVVVGTWEEYLALHGLTRRRADQVVAACGVLETVAERVPTEIGTAVPDLTERALRPLVGLDPDQAVEAVIEAAGEPAGITPATIRQAAARRKVKAAKGPRPRRWRVPGWVVVLTPNRKAGPVTDALAEALRQAQDEEAGREAA